VRRSGRLRGAYGTSALGASVVVPQRDVSRAEDNRLFNPLVDEVKLRA
jgi:hypothetical protein